jgi:hypothetical protein
MVKMKETWGPARTQRYYAVISEGYDWYLIRCQGRGLYVPKCCTYRED